MYSISFSEGLEPPAAFAERGASALVWADMIEIQVAGLI
jgi:hypothetical protein